MDTSFTPSQVAILIAAAHENGVREGLQTIDDATEKAFENGKKDGQKASETLNSDLIKDWILKNKIQMIKIMRECSGLGLKEAKEAYETFFP